jgi:ferrochelatase
LAKGLLLLNLGSPNSCDVSDVRHYLQEFLSDPLVIDRPAIFRYPLVYGLIAPFRASQTAQAYRSVWRADGPPLTVFTQSFAEKLSARLTPEWEVRWAMRYGEHSCAQRLKAWQPDELYIVPLYPQYAESSTRTALEDALKVCRSTNIYVLPDFYEQKEFIEAQTTQIEQQITGFRPDHLLLSFHGLPEHHLTKLHSTCLQSADCCALVTGKNRWCYRAQSQATARALGARSSLDPSRISVSYQSRLGRRPWIKPYTDHVVTELVARGVRRLLVSCPSFVADCLETLEEVQIRLKEQFVNEGGEDLHLVPALNDADHWVEGFQRMLRDLPWEKRR